MRTGLILVLILVSLALFPDGPHPVFVEIRNSQNEIPETDDITFQAWLLSNPNQILDENTTDCYYPAFTSYVKVNCGQFSTWNNQDILHLEVTEISSGEMGIGEYQLTYDASQFFSIENGGIYLGGGGGPPEINLPAEFVFEEDVDFSVDFSQYITGIYTQITSAGGENIEVSIEGSMVTFSPAENWFGEEEHIFEVMGLDGEIVEDNVLVIVTPVNDPPDLNFPPHFQFNEDEYFQGDISQYASDIEGDELSFSVTGSEHITAELEGTILYLTAEPDWNGSEYITIHVSDDQRRDTSTAEVLVIVNPVNDAPVLDLPEQMTFRAGEEATVDFDDYMLDVDGDVLSISVYGDINLNVLISGTLVTFEYDAGWHGSEILIFTVSDNVLRATATDTMQVNIFYPQDTGLASDNFEINDGDTFLAPIRTTQLFEEWSISNFTIVFAYNPLVLSYEGMSSANSIITGGAFDVSETSNGVLQIQYAHYLPISGSGILLELEFEAICFGVSELAFNSCQMAGYNLSNFTDGEVIVDDIGLAHPPVADAGDNFGIMSGATGILDGSNSYDPDGDAITFLWSAPPDIIIDNTTAAITEFTAPIVEENQQFIINLTVSDGMFNTTDMVTVTVYYINHAPEIELPAEFTFDEDTEIVLDFNEYVFDIDEDTLTLSVSGNENVLVDINDLEVTISAVLNWFGSEMLTFTVSDNIRRLEASAEVEIIVLPVNDPPHANAGQDQNVRDGNTVYLDGSSSWDVETEELEYMWLAPAGIMLSDPYAFNPSFTAPQVIDPTQYVFTLIVSDGELDDDDSVIITVQDDEPALLNIELLPDNQACLTWFAPGSAGSGDELEQGFEGVMPPQGWLNIDNDGDGYGWYIYEQNPHSGSSSIGSQSYIPSAGALTPDNWLITPALQAGGLSELRFWVAAQDQYYPAEHYSCLVSTQGPAIENFEHVLIEETLSDTQWREHVFNLSPWAGSTVHIAWRHHDVTDQYIIKLDDVQVINSSTRAVEFSADFNSEAPALQSQSQSAFRDRDLLGYNIFLDTENVGFTEIREYIFEYVVGPHTAGVQAVYDNGESEIVTIEFDPTDTDPDLPLTTGLNRIYPNPFNPETRIIFGIANAQQLNISIYNIKGQKVAELYDDICEPGNHELIWQADNLPSAIYFLRMTTAEYQENRKLILLK